MQVGSMSYGRGPLSIEMGAITGAVDDLVSGYESLVTALPDVAQRVNDMQNGTEDMAHRLEVSIVIYLIVSGRLISTIDKSCVKALSFEMYINYILCLTVDI